jgi:hypothetical protein
VITAVAAESFQPERVSPWLSGRSALTVIGAVMLNRALTKTLTTTITTITMRPGRPGWGGVDSGWCGPQGMGDS